MKRSELEQLKVGTLVYNGHTEGVVKMDGNIKVIEVYIPICAMNNDSKHYDERPEYWNKLED